MIYTLIFNFILVLVLLTLFCSIREKRIGEIKKKIKLIKCKEIKKDEI